MTFRAAASFCIVLTDWFLFVFTTAFKDCSICFCPHCLLLQLEDTEKKRKTCCWGLGRLKDKTLILQMGQLGDGASTGFPQVIFDPLGLFPALHIFPLDSCRSSWPPACLIWSPRSSSNAYLLPCLKWLPPGPALLPTTLPFYSPASVKPAVLFLTVLPKVPTHHLLCQRLLLRTLRTQPRLALSGNVPRAS